MDNETRTGITISTALLEQKLRDYEGGFCDLTTQELLKIHEALSRDRSVAEYILLTIINELEFLDKIYQAESERQKAIEAFLFAFRDYVKRELALNVKTHKSADLLT